jgi:hypothetical protein
MPFKKSSRRQRFAAPQTPMRFEFKYSFNSVVLPYSTPTKALASWSSRHGYADLAVVRPHSRRSEVGLGKFK